MTYRNSQTDDQSTKFSQRVRATAAASWLAIRTWLTALYGSAAALPQRLSSMASGLFLEPPSNPRLVHRHGLRAEGLEQRQMLAGDVFDIPVAEDGDVTHYAAGDVSFIIAGENHGSILVDGNAITYTPNPDYYGSDSFQYILAGDTGPNTVNIDVTPVNDAPTFTAGGTPASVDESTEDRDFSLANWATNLDHGPDNESGQVFEFEVTTDNSAIFTVDGQPTITHNSETGQYDLTYTIAANQSGSANVMVTLKDYDPAIPADVASSATVDFDIVVNALNDPPQLLGTPLVTAEDTALIISADDLAADPDEGPGALSIVSLTADSGEVADNGDGTFTFTPASNFNGSVSFEFTVTDGEAEVEGLGTINVTPEDDPTVLTGANFETQEDTPLTIYASQLATDADGPVTIVGFGDSLQFIPSNNFNGDVIWEFQIKEGDSAPVAGSTTITVLSVNDPPVHEVPDGLLPLEVEENNTLDINGIQVSDADVGTGQLEITLSVGHGTLELATLAGLTFSVPAGGPTGPVATMTFRGTETAVNAALETITYAPLPNWNGTDQLLLNTSDLGNTGGPAETAQSLFNIAVSGINDPPVALPLDVSTDEDESVVIDATDGVSPGIGEDESGQTVSVVPFVDPIDTAHGSVVYNVDGTVTYTPDADYAGPDSFTVALQDDGLPVQTVTRTINVTVDPINDAPTADAISTSTNEETPVSINMLQDTFSPGGGDDEAGQTVSVVPFATFTTSKGGTVEDNGDGTITYTPDTNFPTKNDTDNTDTFTITLTDNDDENPLTVQRTVTVTVNNINDLPENTGGMPDSPITVDEDVQTAIDLKMLTLVDVDSPTIWVTLAVTKGTLFAASTGLVSVTNENTSTMTLSGDPDDVTAFLQQSGAVTYTSDLHYNSDIGGDDTLTITLRDGSIPLNSPGVNLAPVTIIINAVNDAPVVPGDLNVTTDEDTATEPIDVTVGVLPGGGVDEDVQVIFLVGLNSLPSHGVVVIDGNTVTYTPDTNNVLPDSFTVLLSDGDKTVIRTVNVTITPVADAPEVHIPSGTYSTVEDSGVPVVFTGITVTDVDSPIASSTTVTLSVQHGTLTASITEFELVTISGSGSGSIVLEGTLEDIQEYLEDAQFAYLPVADFYTSAPGAEALTVMATVDGGTRYVSQNITVAPENDKAVLAGSLVSPVDVIEDKWTAIQLGQSAVTIGDVDAEDGIMTLRLAASFGVLRLAGSAGSGSPLLVVNGTLNQLNALLYSNGIEYLGPADKAVDAADQINLFVNDNGNTGPQLHNNVYLGTVVIDIAEVNDPPVAPPLSVETKEDTSGTFDVTDGATPGGGTDELGQTVKLDSISGQPANGIVVKMDDASVTYTPNPDFFGADQFKVILIDDGDPAKSVERTVNVTVKPVNDAPSFTLEGDISIDEDATWTPQKWAKNISVGPANESDQVPTFSVSIDNTDNDDLFAVLPAIAADGTLTFTLAEHQNGSATLTVVLNDGAGTADGGVDESTQSFTINVAAVNDPPTYNGDYSRSLSAFEDLPAVLDLSGVTLADVDAEDATTRLRIRTTSGGTISVSVIGVPGLNVVNNGTADVRIQGPLAQINDLLHNHVGAITYTGAANVAGVAVDTITVRFADLGNTGDESSPVNKGVNLPSITVSIQPVNDPPTIAAPSGYATTEDAAAMPVTGISIDDIDAEGSELKVTLSVGHGELAAEDIADDGVVVTALSSSSVQLKGTRDALNDYLGLEHSEENPAPIQYTPEGDFNTAGGRTESLTILVDDQGATGVPGFSTSEATVTITVAPVNDPPQVDGDLAAEIDEDQQLTQAVPGMDLAAGVDPGAANEEGVSQFTIAGLVQGPRHGTLELQLGTNNYTYTPDPNWAGEDEFTVTLRDKGNAEVGSNSFTFTRTVKVTVNQVNDNPTFTAGGDIIVPEDQGVSPVQWATNVSAGPQGADLELGNESGQTASFTVDSVMLVTLVQNEEEEWVEVLVPEAGQLFSVAPSIDPTGVLTYELVEDANGVAEITVTLHDSAGGESAPVTFRLTVTPQTELPENVGEKPFTHDTIEEQTKVVNLEGIELADDDLTAEDEMDIKLEATKGILSVPTVETAEGSGIWMVAGLPEDAVVVVEGGNATSALVLSGTLAALNELFTTSSPISYTGNLDEFGSDTIVLSGDDAVFGWVQIETVDVAIENVNDKPTFTLNQTEVEVLEDSGTTSFSSWNISAGTNEDGIQSVQVQVISYDSSLIDVAVVDGQLQITPKPNAYTDPSDDPVVVTLQVQDNGGIANGGIDTSDPQSLTITVNPVNDAPVLVGPDEVVCDADGPVAIPLELQDADINESNEGVKLARVILSVDKGTLHVDATSGVTGNGTNVVTIDGSFLAVNAALDTLQHTPATGEIGDYQLVVWATDQGNVGSGGVLWTDKTIDISVQTVNNAPSFTGPESIIVAGAEDAWNDVNFDGLQIDDPDALSGIMTLTLTASAGTLHVNAGTGVTLESGQDTAEIVVTGTLSALNGLLTSDGAVSYKGPQDVNNTDSPLPTITLEVNDGGNTGAGDPGTATYDAITVDLAPVNDLPVVHVPEIDPENPLSVNEDESLAIAGVSVSDLDLEETPGAEITVTLSVTNGTLSIYGVPYTEALTGSLSEVNDMLANLAFMPTPGLETGGTAVLAITANDGGATGDDTGVDVTETLSITINPVNDAPTVSLPGTQTIDENAQLVFSQVNGNPITVGDVDSPSVTVTLSVTTDQPGGPGKLQLASGGSWLSEIVITGSPTAVSNTLNGLKYQPALNFAGAVTLTVVANDGALDSEQPPLTINVQAVNTPPGNTGGLPGAVTVNEDTPVQISFAAMNLVDVDAGAGLLKLLLSTTNGGTLYAVGGGGVTVTPVTGGTSLALDGTLGALNAYLDANTIQFKGGSNKYGADSIVLKLNDQGNTGSGGAKEVPLGSVPVTINPVNDKPSFTMADVTIEVTEDTPATFPAWAAFNAGAPYEDGQTALAYQLTGYDPDLVEVDVDEVTGALTVTPKPNATGETTVTISVQDSGGTANGGVDVSDTATFTINVNGEQDAPTADNFAFESIQEDGSLTFTAVDVLTLSGAVDADGDPLSVKSVTITGGGAYTLTGVGTGNNPWVFTPEADWNGTVTFTCEITDGTDVVTVDGTLEVDPVNDDPVLSLPTEAIDLVEAQWIKLSDLGISVSDADDDVLTLTVSVPAGEFRTTAIDEDYLSAQLPLPGNGTVTFIGSADDILNDLALIEYSLADADPGSDPFVTVEMDVTLTDGAKEEVSEGVWEEKLQEGTVELHVADAAPTIELAGAATHNESSTVPYVLTLGPVSDPGGDDLVRMAIYWGDGSVEVFDADSTQVLALNSGGTVAVEHLYGDNSKMVENMIRVSLFSQGKNDEVNVDLPKEYEDAGQLSIKVLNVSPTAAAIIHSGPYQEGTPSGTLTISGVWDPSAVDLALLDVLVDFGVGDLVSVPMPNPLPAGPVDLNVTIPAAFLADNPGGVVRVLLKDDGEGTEYVVNIPVQNKAPILGTLADDTTTAGRTFTKTVQFADPGADSWTATVDFGDGSAPVVYANVGKTFVIDHVYAEATEEETPYTVTVTVTDDDGGSDSETFDVTVIEAATIANRGVFYNGRFGNQLDSSKQALLGGSGEMSGFANYTNYYKGLTGLAIDVNGDHGTITLDDLDFAVGDGSSPSGFVELDPNAVTGFIVLSGQGAGGSDRILITFADYSVMNTWLKVTVKGNDNTNLAQDDVFYFGNAVADVNVGNPTGTVRVSSIDTAALRTNQSPAANSVDVKGVYDVNKDGRVNSIDTAIARVNYRSTVLKHFKG